MSGGGIRSATFNLGIIQALVRLGFLRRFSNYLSPQLGLYSADAWTMVAAYLRNLILNSASSSCCWR